MVRHLLLAAIPLTTPIAADAGAPGCGNCAGLGAINHPAGNTDNRGYHAQP
jgi:hypothetical protein